MSTIVNKLERVINASKTITGTKEETTGEKNTEVKEVKRPVMQIIRNQGTE